MIRILYCTDTLTAGGVESQLIELVTRLDRKRFEPHVLCLYGERAGYSLHFATALEAAHVPVHMLDLKWSPLDKACGVGYILRAIWRFRPDIVHAVNYHSNLLARIARPLMPRELRLVGTVRNNYSDKQLFYEWLSWRECSVIVCNSPHIEERLASLAKVPRDRVQCILNGIDLERFADNPNPSLREQLAPDAQRVLLVMGRISRQKSPHLVAEAVGLLRTRGVLPANTCVWIVGERQTQHYQTLLDETIARYDLGHVVCQYPPTAQPEAFYHAADITVLASLWEGLPNVALESLAAGRPVIVSEAANAAQIIEPGVTGWVARTGDVEHLAATLGHALATPDSEFKSLAAACRRRAERYSAGRMVNEFECLYQTL